MKSRAELNQILNQWVLKHNYGLKLLSGIIGVRAFLRIISEKWVKIEAVFTWRDVPELRGIPP